MKKTLSLAIVVSFGLASLVGCGASAAPAAPEQKKEFMGGPMPQSFMQQQAGAMQKARDAAAKAGAAHGKQ